jgi:hypothetical protein
VIKLLKYFNGKYGQSYGNLDYPKNNKQFYKIYQTIKSYGISDNDLIDLLKKTNLPIPKTIEEKEMYADCLYNIDDSEILKQITENVDIFKLIKNILSFNEDGELVVTIGETTKTFVPKEQSINATYDSDSEKIKISKAINE